MDELLTEAEHDLVDKLASCAREYGRIVATDDMHVRGQDLTEFIAHIHALQNAVLAQAAARAFPDRYRLAGSRVRA